MSETPASTARSRRKVAEQLERDQLSVRSLNDWSPSASARSTARMSGPPTERLRLDLSDVGAGAANQAKVKTMPNKEKHRELFGDKPAEGGTEAPMPSPTGTLPSVSTRTTLTRRSQWTEFSSATQRSTARTGRETDRSTARASITTDRSKTSASSESRRKRSRKERRVKRHPNASSNKVLPDILKPVSGYPRRLAGVQYPSESDGKLSKVQDVW